MASTPNLQELIDSIGRDAASDDALDQLATASRTVTELNEISDAALGYFVDRARRAGKSWVEISKVLGVTKQAVHKRFAGPGPTIDLPTIQGQFFERFTDRARRVLQAAGEVAKASGHPYLGTEHLLLAQYTERECLAAKILVAAGVAEEKARAAVRAITPDGPKPFDGNPVPTARAARAMSDTIAEARNLGHNYIGTEHMLLALYGDPESLAAKILTDQGLDADTARGRVLDALAAYPQP